MNIEEYADILQKEIVIRRYPNQKNRYTASFDGCEVREGGMLSGTYGNSDSPTNAINDYVAKIKGKTIVFNAMTNDRVDYGVPETLEP